MKTTSIVLCMALTIGLSIGTLSLNHQQQASAQMGMMKLNMFNRTSTMSMLNNMMNRTGTMGTMMNPNMMNNMMMNPMMFTGQNITSSVSLLRSMMNGISSQVKVSLGDAVMSAQRELGNASHAIAANIGEVRGYLIYSILGIDPDMNLQQIIIDPGNGKTLLSQKLPLWQVNQMMNPMMGPMGMNPMMGHQ